MRRLIIAAVVLAACVPVAACGPDSADPGAPASVAPADSIYYAELELDLEGDQAETARSLLERLPGSGDPDDRLANLLDEISASGKLGVTFTEDVKPWLGDTLAAFASGVDSDGDPTATAALIAADDEGAARDFAAEAMDTGLEDQYRGVEYRHHRDTAMGVVEGFLVVGNQKGFKRVVDAEKGDSLAESERYEDALADLPGDRVGFIWFDGKPTAKAIAEGLGGLGGLGEYREALEATGAAALMLEEDAAVIEGKIPASFGPYGAAFGVGTERLGLVPADSFAAFGGPDMRDLLEPVVLGAASVLGGRDALARTLREEAGLDLDRDVLGWPGEYRLFLRGRSLADLDGALYVETKDAAASGRAIAALEKVLREDGSVVRPLSEPELGSGFAVEVDDAASEPLLVFQHGTESVVVAYGEEAAREALGASEPLDEDERFRSAVDSLGEGFEPSIYIAAQPLIRLIEGESDLTAQYQLLVKPYLELLDGLVGGSVEESDSLRTRLAIRLR